jgi:hypothetical protein
MGHKINFDNMTIPGRYLGYTYHLVMKANEV